MQIAENDIPANSKPGSKRIELKGLLRSSGESMERIKAQARVKESDLEGAMNSDKDKETALSYRINRATSGYGKPLSTLPLSGLASQQTEGTNRDEEKKKQEEAFSPRPGGQRARNGLRDAARMTQSWALQTNRVAGQAYGRVGNVNEQCSMLGLDLEPLDRQSDARTPQRLSRGFGGTTRSGGISFRQMKLKYASKGAASGANTLGVRGRGQQTNSGSYAGSSRILSASFGVLSKLQTTKTSARPQKPGKGCLNTIQNELFTSSNYGVNAAEHQELAAKHLQGLGQIQKVNVSSAEQLTMSEENSKAKPSQPRMNQNWKPIGQLANRTGELPESGLQQPGQGLLVGHSRSKADLNKILECEQLESRGSEQQLRTSTEALESYLQHQQQQKDAAAPDEEHEISTTPMNALVSPPKSRQSHRSIGGVPTQRSEKHVGQQLVSKQSGRDVFTIHDLDSGEVTQRTKEPKRKAATGKTQAQLMDEDQLRRRKIADFRRHKRATEDRDPFGIGADKRPKSKATPASQRKKTNNNNNTAKAQASKQVHRRYQTINENIIDYPRHIRVISDEENLGEARETLRRQKFFHKQFIPEMHDLSNRHFYQGVYSPNQYVNPEEEQKVELKEYIRDRQPKTMRQEPSQALALPNVTAEQKAQRDEKLNNFVDPQYKFDRELPYRLVKQFAHKNEKVDANPFWNCDELQRVGLQQNSGRQLEEVPLEVSREGQMRITELLEKKQSSMYPTHGNEFSKQRRMIEELVDEGKEFEIRPAPRAATGRVYQACVEMVHASNLKAKDEVNFFRRLAVGPEAKAQGDPGAPKSKQGAAGKLTLTEASVQQLEPHSVNVQLRSGQSASKGRLNSAAPMQAKSTRAASRQDDDSRRSTSKSKNAAGRSQPRQKERQDGSRSSHTESISKVSKRGSSQGSQNDGLVGSKLRPTGKPLVSGPPSSRSRRKNYFGQKTASGTQRLDGGQDEQPTGKQKTYSKVEADLASIRQLRGEHEYHDYVGDIGPQQSGAGQVGQSSESVRAKTSRVRQEQQVSKHTPRQTKDKRREMRQETGHSNSSGHGSLHIPASIQSQLLKKEQTKPKRTAKAPGLKAEELQRLQAIELKLKVRDVKRRLTMSGQEDVIDALQFMTKLNQQAHFGSQLTSEMDSKAEPLAEQNLLDIEEKLKLSQNHSLNTTPRAGAMMLKSPIVSSPNSSVRASEAECQPRLSSKQELDDRFLRGLSMKYDKLESIRHYDEKTKAEKELERKQAQDMLQAQRKGPHVDFSQENPEAERILQHFFDQQYLKMGITSQKNRTKQSRTQRKPKHSQTLSDVDRLLRSCYNITDDKEAQLHVENQVNQIADYNTQVLNTVSQIQENLKFLDKEVDEENEKQFDPNSLLKDQKRGERQDYENFLKPQPGHEQHKEKVENYQKMRLLVGTIKTRANIWKPDAPTFPKQVRALVNSQTLSQDKPVIDRKSAEIAKRLPQAATSVHKRLAATIDHRKHTK